MRLVRDVLKQEMDDRSRPDMRITAEALGALQEASEMAMTTLMEMSNHCAIHAKRVTLMDKDIRLVRSLVDIWDPNNWLSSHRKGGIGRALSRLPM
jgi:histone H3/H4